MNIEQLAKLYIWAGQKRTTQIV